MVKKIKKLKNIKDVILLAKKLYMLEGIRYRRYKKATNILKNYLNFKVIKIKSGTKCWDWIVPKNGTLLVLKFYLMEKKFLMEKNM